MTMSIAKVSPGSRYYLKSVAVGDGGAAQISLVAKRDSHVVVDVGIGGLADQRLLKGIERGVIVSGGILGQTQVAVGFGIFGIEAESGARFRDGVVGIVVAIEQIGKLAMCFREARHQLCRFGEDIERFFETVLLAQDCSQNKACPGIVRVVQKKGPNFAFRHVVFLGVDESGNLRDRTIAGTGQIGGCFSWQGT